MDRAVNNNPQSTAVADLAGAGLTRLSQEAIIINEINQKKDRKNKKTKKKLELNDVSPTYVSSIFGPGAPDTKISTKKLYPLKLVDTQEHLFGAWREDIDDNSKNTTRVDKQWHFHNTHENLFGAPETLDSPKPRLARENTMEKLFGEAEPAVPRHRRRWDSDSHMVLFCPSPDVQAVSPRQVESTKDKIFPVGSHGVFDKTYPWRRRPKSRRRVREDTYLSLFGSSRDQDVPLARRSSSPASDVKHEEFCSVKSHRSQQYHNQHCHQLPCQRSSSQYFPTTPDALFENQLASSTSAQVSLVSSIALKKPKFLPIKIHRAEQPKTFENLFPSRENVTSSDRSWCDKLPIHIRRVELRKTCIYGPPDDLLEESLADPAKEMLADPVKPNPVSEKYTPRTSKVITVS